MALWTISRTEAGGYAILYDRKGKPTMCCGEIGSASRTTLRQLEEFCIRESQPGDVLRVEGREYVMPIHGREMARA